MIRKLIPVDKVFKLTDEEFKHVEAFRRKDVLFCHYDIADIAKECGFYERLYDWFKKECAGCNFSNWDDVAPYLYNPEEKTFTLRGNKMIFEEEPVIDGYKHNNHGTMEKVNEL